MIYSRRSFFKRVAAFAAVAVAAPIAAAEIKPREKMGGGSALDKPCIWKNHSAT